MSATTPARPPAPGAPVPSDAVAGLARQMDRLRADVDALDGLPARVEEVAGLVAQVANAVAALSSRPAPQPAPSWLMGPTDPDLLSQWVDELATWMRAIFLRLGRHLVAPTSTAGSQGLQVSSHACTYGDLGRWTRPAQPQSQLEPEGGW